MPVCVSKARVETPLGVLGFLLRGERLCAVCLEQTSSHTAPYETGLQGHDPGGVVTRMQAYWRGALEALHEVAVAPEGTPFQKRVWGALCEIPPGQTRSYQEIALSLGLPRAARAVGAACGANPIPLVIPCHRVIAHNGGLGGYAWGLECKQKLLLHERTYLGGS